ncbi:DNA translocase FtsK [candidate division CSSED10-310 bacterium]|uniref:DNA translocase FtsK n=1 Tax=candidate division CSSED10-310 bacterium TaxID=2855610 RepID=A0ABV6Z2Z3_UNCC1
MAQKKRNKKKIDTPESNRNILGEITGIILFALAFFIFITLISVDSQDPSLNTAVDSRKVHNYGGIIGAAVADILYQFVGYASFLIPVFIIIVGLRRFRKEKASHRVLKFVGGVFLFLEIAVLLQLRWPYADPFGKGLTVKTGGVLGEYLKAMLINHFNILGSYVFMLTLFIITLVLLTGISVRIFIDKLQNLKNQFLISAIPTFSRLFSALTVSREKPVVEAAPGPVKKRKKKKRKEPFVEDDQFEVDIIPVSKPAVQKRVVAPKKEEGKFVQEKFSFLKDVEEYVMPSIGLLDDPPAREDSILKRELTANSQILLEKLKNFDVTGRITQIFPGPVITRYEFEPDPGIKLSRITSLADDLGLAIRAKVSPIVAPVPGKSVVGIEIPNQKKEIILLKEIVTSDEYQRMSSKLKLALGKDTSGIPYAFSLTAMPHLLVAGATGAGKSVCIHSLIASLLYSADPQNLQMILIDPKMLELSVYNKIPHLREPVVTDAKKASQALQWAVAEMENRYKILAQAGVRNIELYNDKMKQKLENGEDLGEEMDEESPYPMPYLVIILDELADLMMVAASDVENSIARLAQMARASGIHLIISTQRPSVNVITGIIKANFPSRIAFQVSSKIDSRTILDANGAERLLGKGDMLFKPATGRMIRLHGAFVSEFEVQRLVQFVSQFKRQTKPESIFKIIAKKKETTHSEEEYDQLFDEAVRIIVNSGNASISMLQRRLRVGHSRAARLIDIMEQEGVVGPFEGSKAREVLWKPQDLPPLEEDFDD